MRAILISAVILCACSKDDSRLYIQLDARGRMCAIEYPWMGGIGHDTIIGQIDYATGDTLPGTGRWNITAKPGESVTFRACPLTQDATPMILEASGDVPEVSASSAAPDCAVMEFVARHQ